MDARQAVRHRVLHRQVEPPLELLVRRRGAVRVRELLRVIEQNACDARSAWHTRADAWLTRRPAASIADDDTTVHRVRDRSHGVQDFPRHPQRVPVLGLQDDGAPGHDGITLQIIL